MERIDEIMAKDRRELTDEEFNYLIEWETQKRVNDESFKRAEQQRLDAYDAIIDIERARLAESLATMEEMREMARERLERLENE